MRSFSAAGQARLFWPIVIALLIFLAVIQVLSIRDESATWDEPLELAAGYSYLKTGDFRLNPEHPPLAKVIAALPLIALGPNLPLDSDSWRQADQAAFGREFLYRNSVPAESILFAARLACIFLTLCLGVAIAVWTRAKLGTSAALLALTFYVFDPTVIAHGRYVKNDLAVSLFAFLACIAWGAYLTRPRIFRLVASGLTLGCAIAAKFSAVFLLPVFVILYAIRRWQRKDEAMPAAILSLCGVAFVSAIVVALCYAPAAAQLVPLTRSMREHRLSVQMLYAVLPPDLPAASSMISVSRRLGLQAHPFLLGLLAVFKNNRGGHEAYLLGMHSMSGWWYFFPVAFAVKTPVATLAGLLLAAWLGLRARPWTRLRATSFHWYVLAVPAAVYGALTIASPVNIGIRHLLPAYPFLFVLAAGLLTRATWKAKSAVIAVIVTGLAVESLSIYPYYTSFFNILSGGPAHGRAILVDSNLDWGQDARRLKTWMSTHHVPEICLAYFGNEDLDRLGIRYYDLPVTGETAARDALDCWAAISATPLQGAYRNPDDFAWLRDRKPSGHIGYSIYLFDLRKPPH
jgi:hypothetical protein